VQVNLYPLNVHNQDIGFQPRLVNGASAKKIIAYLKDISKSFGTNIEYVNGIGRIVIASKDSDPPLTASKDEKISARDAFQPKSSPISALRTP
jgi:hypothetical protein